MKILLFPYQVVTPLDTPDPAANLALDNHADTAMSLLREAMTDAIAFWAYFWFALLDSLAITILAVLIVFVIELL